MEKNGEKSRQVYNIHCQGSEISLFQNSLNVPVNEREREIKAFTIKGN